MNDARNIERQKLFLLDLRDTIDALLIDIDSEKEYKTLEDVRVYSQKVQEVISEMSTMIDSESARWQDAKRVHHYLEEAIEVGKPQPAKDTQSVYKTLVRTYPNFSSSFESVTYLSCSCNCMDSSNPYFEAHVRENQILIEEGQNPVPHWSTHVMTT